MKIIQAKPDQQAYKAAAQGDINIEMLTKELGDLGV
jgi:hypothetical protein